MAVFPDRIVLKNSTDSQAQIETAIQSGGSDEIAQGEVVIGLSTGAATLYTKDAAGTIVTIAGTVTSVNGQTGDTSIDVEDLANFQYTVDPTKQSFFLSGPSNNIPSASGMWDIGSNFNNYFAWYDTDPIHAWLNLVPIGTAIEFVTRHGYKHTAVTSSTAGTYASGADYISFSGYPWPQELLDAQANNEPITVQEVNAFITPTDGEALVYEASTGLWRPGSGASLPTAQDGEALIWENGQWIAGPIIGGVNYTPANTDPNFADVSLLLLFNGTDASTTFIDSSSNALTVTPSGNARISAANSKYGGASGYFDGNGDKIVVASDPGMAFGASDDFTIEFWVWAENASGVMDGGIMVSANATTFTTGVSMLVWDHANSRNAISLWNYAYSVNSPVVSINVPVETWSHVAFVRNGTTVTSYVNGVAGSSVTSTNAWDFSDGGTAVGQYPGGYNGSFNGYLDDLRVTKGVARYTSNFTAPTTQSGTSAGDIVIPYSIDRLDDVDTSTVAPVDGQALVWDNTAQKWEPGSVAAEGGGGGGRGDGGDFDTGTVDSAYVFGVYGGGDFDAGSTSTTAVAPFAHAYIDSNNVSSATTHAGMSSAAHVYVASTDSYIDFTFSAAQPNADYSVLHSGEAGWNVLEVENKTTSGFRISFYDEATGNVLTTGAVGIGAPVITVYDSDPTITVSSSDGVDLPAELLGDDEGPDGGSF